MKKINKRTAVLFAGLFLASLGAVAVPAGAQTFCAQDAQVCPDGRTVGRSGPNCEFVCPSPTTTRVIDLSGLLQQIKVLQNQLAELTRQKGALMADLQQTFLLTKSLSRGMSSEEVSTLQEILAADPEVYPEGLVTGFFGALTEKAVKRFQKKYGVEQLGIVGPKTRGALQSFLSGLSTSTAGLPPGLVNKLNWGNLGTSTASSTTIQDHKITICHNPNKGSGGNTITIGLPALPAHIAHGDYVGTCVPDPTTPPATTTPDLTSPIISNLAVTSTASTTAYISWLTNEPASGTVWYSTTTPVNTSSAITFTNGVFSTYHLFGLEGLAASTTYYYLVGSSDAAGNAATSSQQSFVTNSSIQTLNY